MIDECQDEDEAKQEEIHCVETADDDIVMVSDDELAPEPAHASSPPAEPSQPETLAQDGQRQGSLQDSDSQAVATPILVGDSPATCLDDSQPWWDEAPPAHEDSQLPSGTAQALQSDVCHTSSTCVNQQLQAQENSHHNSASNRGGDANRFEETEPQPKEDMGSLQFQGDALCDKPSTTCHFSDSIVPAEDDSRSYDKTYPHCAHLPDEKAFIPDEKSDHCAHIESGDCKAPEKQEDSLVPEDKLQALQFCESSCKVVSKFKVAKLAYPCQAPVVHGEDGMGSKLPSQEDSQDPCHKAVTLNANTPKN